MALQRIRVGAAELGSRDVPNFERIRDEMRTTRSRAMFCNRCGEVWGRFETVGATYTTVYQRPCAAHGDGRLWDGWLVRTDAFGLEGLPASVLRYELERSIEFALKEQT